MAACAAAADAWNKKERGNHLSGLRLDLPWGWATDKKSGPGSFSVARVTLQKHDIGAIEGRITQGPDAYAGPRCLLQPIVAEAEGDGGRNRVDHGRSPGPCGPYLKGLGYPPASRL